MDDVMRDIADHVLDRIDVDKFDGRSALLTGASGLLGQHIFNVLKDCPLSDLTIQVRSGLPAWVERGWANVVYADLANENDAARLPYADIVIDAASYAQPLRFLADPLLAMRSASYGLMALLEKCNVGGRFLYISSSEVYCDSPANPPYLEGDVGTISPYHPRACYIMAKLWGEAMTNLYRNRGISTVSVRPGISYGPGTRKGDKRSWAEFVERAVTTGEIRLRDAGAVKRTFGYISDILELIFKALLDGTQSVYNVGGCDLLSIRELAETVGGITGAQVVVPQDDEQGVKGTPPDLTMSNTRAMIEFGKVNFESFDFGMKETINWWRRVHG